MAHGRICLNCGFLTIQERELSQPQRIMLGTHGESATMPAYAEKTRCFKNLWDYDLIYAGDTFDGVIEEIKRIRDDCPGFVRYEAGFTPAQHMENQSEQRKEKSQWRIAKLGFWGALLVGVVGAIISGLFLLCEDSGKSQSSHIETNGSIQAPISILQETGPVTIIYNIPPTATTEAIDELENKLKQADDKIELTRKELELLTASLRDLDQRTSGLEKLPDGRTKLGQYITGHPSIVIQEHDTAVSYFNDGNIEQAFEHSQNAIDAYQKTKKIKRSMSTGDLKPESVEVIYRLGALLAQRLRKTELANLYAQETLEAVTSPRNQALMSTTLANLNRFDEALEYINEALKSEPHNLEYSRLRKTYTNRLRN